MYLNIVNCVYRPTKDNIQSHGLFKNRACIKFKCTGISGKLTI